MSDKKKIFITEDEFIVSKNLQYKLESLGYIVTGTSPSGEMAIEQIRKNQPDLVLMDIMLAGDLDGIDTARKIREEFDIPIIFLTAYSSEEISKRAALADPYAYILKPYEERELEINISIALYKTEAEKKLLRKQQELIELNNRLDSVVQERTAALNKEIEKREKQNAWLQKFVAIIDQTSDHIVVSNRDGEIEYVNQSLLDFKGRKQNELMGISSKEMISDSTINGHYEQLLGTVIEKGMNFSGELKCNRKDGKSFSATQVVIPLKSEDNYVTHFASICRIDFFNSK